MKMATGTNISKVQRVSLWNNLWHLFDFNRSKIHAMFSENTQGKISK